jgi:hypothetical protein
VHGQHVSWRQGVHEAAPCRNQIERVFERKDAGEVRRHVFADAVAEHRARLHAPRHPQARERVLGDEQQRLREAGPAHLRIAAVAQQIAQIAAQLGTQVLGTPIECIAKDGLAIELAAHPAMLAALSAEEEGDRARRAVMSARPHRRTFGPRQQLDRLWRAARDDAPAVLELPATELQRMRNVSDRRVRIRPQVLDEVRRHCGKGCRGLGR